MLPVAKTKAKKVEVRPRVLIVDDEPNLVELIGHVVGQETKCRLVTASTIAQARNVLESQQVDLLVTDVNLPDGDGTTLLADLREHQPAARAIVITGAPSVDRAITAMRGGALDFVPKPFNNEHLAARIREALQQQAAGVKQEKRIDRLKGAVKRLNEARRTISKKVDLLCNDLVSAYGELSRQLDGVRTQEGFRKYVADAKDLEQLLCHAMDWMLRQIGYSNLGVWLAGEDGEFQLGAYMKYTVAGEPILCDALKRVLLPLAVRDTIVRTTGKELESHLTPQEGDHLKGQDVLAVNCTYLGESLAAVVFFRDERSPFTDDDEALLKAISPIFALALANVVRGGEGGEMEHDESDPHFAGDEEDREERKGRKDVDDWWKRGEMPPF